MPLRRFFNLFILLFIFFLLLPGWALAGSTQAQKDIIDIANPTAKPAVVDRHGHYIKYAIGIVKDTRTGLEWYAGPDKDTNWNEAKRWVESLNVANGGWHMPTRKELEALYKMGTGKRNMTPLLKTTGWQVWSGETKDSSSSWGFGFGSGFEFWDTSAFSSDRRGFAVRSRK